MEDLLQIDYLDIEENEEYENLLNKVASKCFEQENIDKNSFYISITLTTDENIRKINNKYRNIDKSTDVLSFPMFEKEELKLKIKEKTQYQDILGDVIISIPTVKRQAIEYGHAFERELAYMLVHAFYHLMGYDHMTEEEKNQMRQKEEVVLEKLNIKR